MRYKYDSIFLAICSIRLITMLISFVYFICCCAPLFYLNKFSNKNERHKNDNKKILSTTNYVSKCAILNQRCDRWINRIGTSPERLLSNVTDGISVLLLKCWKWQWLNTARLLCLYAILAII